MDKNRSELFAHFSYDDSLTYEALLEVEEELTREVREHNNFACRVPILEEQMKVANHRIADLENHERMKERN